MVSDTGNLIPFLSGRATFRPRSNKLFPWEGVADVEPGETCHFQRAGKHPDKFPGSLAPLCMFIPHALLSSRVWSMASGLPMAPGLTYADLVIRFSITNAAEFKLVEGVCKLALGR